ncbi:nucleotidyl transferase AbiEii/AbiGii toxin family protein [candidate division KSB1 bacterium]|nr:nucleotidyl transferase AbiEii/AbiGii toxin family protein [candidate division KSB1 bacterium]
MSPPTRKNVAHSVLERLRNRTKTNKDDFNLLLRRYGMERFLYRLSVSSHAENFILKGASLFLVWKGQSYRVTRDADFLLLGRMDINTVTAIFRELCAVDSLKMDGISFSPESVKCVSIREENVYGGLRVTFTGMLNKVRIPLQVGIGFGDKITPSVERVDFPTLLDAPVPRLRAYPRYSVVAEKFETLVSLGISNSRMKDFFDVWLLSRLFEFDGDILCEAIRKTFERRGTSLPEDVPFAFTDEFKKDAQKETQWKAFVKRAKPEIPDIEVANLDSIIENIAKFLLPVSQALQSNDCLKQTWLKGGLWY